MRKTDVARAACAPLKGLDVFSDPELLQQDDVGAGFKRETGQHATTLVEVGA